MVLETISKYFFIAICSLYVYTKILNLKSSKKNILLFFPLSFSFGVFAYIFRIFPPPIRLAILYAFFICVVKIIHNQSLKISVITSAISMSVSFFLFTISTITISPIILFAISKRPQIPSFDSITMVLIGLIQTILSILIFRIKRLKNGIPHIIESNIKDISILLCVTIMFAVSFIGMENNKYTHLVIAIFVITISGLGLFLWWKEQISKKYLDMVSTNEIKNLYDEIDSYKDQIAALKGHNDELSKIIHRDNKLIPTMQIAVKELIHNIECSTCKQELMEKSDMLLKSIDGLLIERNSILKLYESQNKRLPSTGVDSVDALLKYFLIMSNESGVCFDIAINCNIKHLIEHIIAEKDITTLLADLIENAIISTNDLPQRNVLVTISMIDQYYSIDIFDSGIMFEAKTLVNLGQNRITTHSDSGGTGIGLMTTFEMLKKYKASFVIDECIESSIYVKKVSICFDSLCEYRIKSTRDEVAVSCSGRCRLF